MAKIRKTSSHVAKKNRANGSQPTREAIALRAYEIYLERGCAPGHELEDWTRAEQELSEMRVKAIRKPSAKAIAA